jgi:hypothetical protein
MLIDDPALYRFAMGSRLDGDIESAARALRAWIDGGGRAQAFQYGRFSKSVRNAYLRAAADALGEPDWWRRAVRLADQVRLFNARRWPRWRHLLMAPDDATAVEQSLFLAARAGARLPTTAQGLRKALGDCAR